MNGSIERVRAVINGSAPDRPPLFDLFRNDAVIEHFTGCRLTIENGADLVYRAYEPAVDGTRPLVRAPQDEAVLTRDDGLVERRYRWTTWIAHRAYPDARAYADAKRRALAEDGGQWTAKSDRALAATLEEIDAQRAKLGEVFFIPTAPGVGLMGIYGEIGLEAFAYYLADCPDVIDDLIEASTRAAIAWADHLPADHGIEVAFVGDDIAFKSGPMCAPAWFDRHYHPRLARVIDAYHRQGVKVLFHSDGNLNPILDGLVDAGIDGLNPIEVMAGMDIADIHRRHPRLFMAGGIDVSQLLPYGRPAEVRDAVRAAIDAAEGRIMIGSSTELHDGVPLANYLALREAVLEA